MIISDWTAEKARGFSRQTLGFRHNLHERAMFDDAGLISLLDRYPRDQLGVFTMGGDPVDWRSWRRGEAGNLSGAELLDAAKAGRIWLNLRKTNDYLPEYAELEREIFDEKEAHVKGLRTFKRDLGMLISSSNAQVFYHLDVPLVSLWQLRGRKRVWVYPVADPYIGDSQLERIVLKETAEQFAYDTSWDKGATAFDMEPGVMITWPQNAPHRIENGPMLNVSLSIEFMTPPAVMRANVLYANGVLRKAGLRPRVQTVPHPSALAKIALARGVKYSGMSKTFRKNLASTFRVDPGAPNAVADF